MRSVSLGGTNEDSLCSDRPRQLLVLLFLVQAKRMIPENTNILVGGRITIEARRGHIRNIFIWRLHLSYLLIIWLHPDSYVGETILKGKRNAYSLWLLFISKEYKLCEKMSV